MPQAAPPLVSDDTLQALPAGTRVAEFEVRRTLGSGGFGIVYLAWDHALEREVALKEYMPGTLAGRGTGLQVSVRSKSTADTFALGLRSFINEARLLARFDHPSLVKVYRFWEDNGTAYMVMPHYPGRTLRQMRHSMVVPPADAACRRVLDALLSALEVLHREGVYHRDIAPDNILIGDDGLPVLLDFGAARRVLGDRTQALTSIMKPHYAPLEQYADSTAMRQGPWTDLYALGGTMYYLVTGQVPVAAASRALHDDQPRLAQQGARGCSHGLLSAIDWMLALRPPERPQSVHMLRDVLEGRITLPGRSASDKTVPGFAAREMLAGPSAHRTEIDLGGDAVAGAHEATVLQATDAAAASALQTPPPAGTAPPSTRPPCDASALATTGSPSLATLPPPSLAPTRQRNRNRTLALAGLLGGLLMLNGVAWWWFNAPTAPSSSPSASALGTAATSTATVVVPLANASPTVAATLPDTQQSKDDVGEETVLSVLPARALAARAAGASAVPTPTGAGTTMTAVAPASAKPQDMAPAPRSRPSPEPLAAVVTAAAASIGPRERCGDRNFLSMLICVKRECEVPALRGHAECVKMRQQEEAQRERTQSR